jgi:hypothetical protein
VELESRADREPLSATELRDLILSSLSSQGFAALPSPRALFDVNSGKEFIRNLHKQAKMAKIERAATGLRRHEPLLLQRFADGSEFEPTMMKPVLRRVEAGTGDELLFRYARLLWSIPISSGYGRRLRFLVMDEFNNKLIGIIGLGDPVYRLQPRDAWIGWSEAARHTRLRSVMDAFVLGAVPPYSSLLCGKLVALLAASNEVQRAFTERYAGSISRISCRTFDGTLALLTTTSALGRSSMYNRLKLAGRTIYISTGYTSGSGEFHFSNGVYAEMAAFAREHCSPTSKHKAWGTGWRNRRELVRNVLPRVGLSRELVYHGVQREVFVVPLASNAADYLRGEASTANPYDLGVEQKAAEFMQRWALPRAERETGFRDFQRNSLRIWPES